MSIALHKTLLPGVYAITVDGIKHVGQVAIDDGPQGYDYQVLLVGAPGEQRSRRLDGNSMSLDSLRERIAAEYETFTKEGK